MKLLILFVACGYLLSGCSVPNYQDNSNNINVLNLHAFVSVNLGSDKNLIIHVCIINDSDHQIMLARQMNLLWNVTHYDNSMRIDFFSSGGSPVHSSDRIYKLLRPRQKRIHGFIGDELLQDDFDTSIIGDMISKGAEMEVDVVDHEIVLAGNDWIKHAHAFHIFLHYDGNAWLQTKSF